jgi:hypothetical protein
VQPLLHHGQLPLAGLGELFLLPLVQLGRRANVVGGSG